MWSSEQSDLATIEALVQDAAWLPQPTGVFRARVLATVTQDRRQSRWRERCQYAATVAIAATMMWFLPGSIPTLQDVRPASSVTVLQSPAPATTSRSWTLIDDYEWGLVQAALAKQSHSAGLIHGLL